MKRKNVLRMMFGGRALIKKSWVDLPSRIVVENTQTDVTERTLAYFIAQGFVREVPSLTVPPSREKNRTGITYYELTSEGRKWAEQGWHRILSPCAECGWPVDENQIHQFYGEKGQFYGEKGQFRVKAKLIHIEGRPLPIVQPVLGREPSQSPDDPIQVRYLADTQALRGRQLPWAHPDRTVPASMPRSQYDELPVGEWDGDDKGNITRIREAV